jgi:hypothetical protein
VCKRGAFAPCPTQAFGAAGQLLTTSTTMMPDKRDEVDLDEVLELLQAQMEMMRLR